MAEKTVEVSRKVWLAALDLTILAVGRQIKDNQDFVRLIDLELAMEKYLADPQNMSPLIAIIAIYLLDQGQVFSNN
jgi:hypothetical protein